MMLPFISIDYISRYGVSILCYVIVGSQGAEANIYAIGGPVVRFFKFLTQSLIWIILIYNNILYMPFQRANET